ELAHDPEGEVALELAAARGQHTQARACASACLCEQPRLADSGRSLDHAEAAFAAFRRVDECAQDRELGLALEQAKLDLDTCHVSTVASAAREGNTRGRVSDRGACAGGC